MSEDREALGEIKIGSCRYVVYRNKADPGVINLEGVSCDIREDVEKGNRLIEALFGESEVRFKAPKLVKEEENPVKA